MRNMLSHINFKDWFIRPIAVEYETDGFTIFVEKDGRGLETDIDVELLKEIMLSGFSLSNIDMDCHHLFNGEEERAYSLSFSL